MGRESFLKQEQVFPNWPIILLFDRRQYLVISLYEDWILEVDRAECLGTRDMRLTSSQA